MFVPPFTVDATLPVDFDFMVYQHHGSILPFVHVGENRGFWQMAYAQGKELLEMMASRSSHLDQDAMFVDHKSEETGGDGRIALKVTYVLPEESRSRSLNIHCSRHIKLPGRYAQGLYVTAHEQVISRFHVVNLRRQRAQTTIAEWYGKGKERQWQGKDKGGKGKGKGKNGGCAICGAPEHWKNECPRNKGGKGKGWHGKGKGQTWQGRSVSNFEGDWSGSGDKEWNKSRDHVGVSSFDLLEQGDDGEGR